MASGNVFDERDDQITVTLYSHEFLENDPSMIRFRVSLPNELPLNNEYMVALVDVLLPAALTQTQRRLHVETDIIDYQYVNSQFVQLLRVLNSDEKIITPLYVRVLHPLIQTIEITMRWTPPLNADQHIGEDIYTVLHFKPGPKFY